MPHDNAVISYILDGDMRYFLNNFYVCGNEGRVPISITTDFITNLTQQNSIGDPINRVPTVAPIMVGASSGAHASNKVMLVSKQCFAYNPKSFYRMRVRGCVENVSSQTKFGIVGFTSYPIDNLLDMHDDVNLNQSLNMSRFISGTDGYGVFPEADSGQTADNVYNMEFTTLQTGSYASWEEKIGYFAKRAWSPVSTIDPVYQETSIDGVDITSFTPLNAECNYFSPMIHCNLNSTSIDTYKTLFDSIIIEEFKDMYVL